MDPFDLISRRYRVFRDPQSRIVRASQVPSQPSQSSQPSRNIRANSRDRFGATVSHGVRAGSPAGFTDPRLRGLDLAPGAASGASGGYDMAARRYAITQGDPYEEAARRERDIGHRFPLPYQAASALAGRPHSPTDPFADLNNENAVWSAGSIAGQHMTQMGTVGNASAPDWDARHRFGYGQLGARGTGYSEEWDQSQSLERKAGRLTTTGIFEQAVNPEWPYLNLSTGGARTEAEGTYRGNALLAVTAGRYETSGASQSRTFLLGGGFIGAFDLKGWDVVKVNVRELLVDTFVEFAWSTYGLSGEDRTLYFPQRYISAATSIPVPEGAYELFIENPNPAVAGTTVTLEWTSRLTGAPFTFSSDVSDNQGAAAPRPNWFFGLPIKVLGSGFRITSDADVIWGLRPI